MKKTKIVRFVEGIIFLPIMTMVTPLGSIPGSGLNAMPVQVVVAPQKVVQVDPTLKLEADAIDTYFSKRGMPLAGTGMKMVQAAEDNDLDWRLLAAVAVRESTGGKNACNSVKNNPFGWGSCRIGFDSIDRAIDTVAINLGGNNPNTASHYNNKTTTQILRAYNPPSVVKHYAEQVLSIMNDIGASDFAVTTGAATT